MIVAVVSALAAMLGVVLEHYRLRDAGAIAALSERIARIEAKLEMIERS